MLKKGYHLSKKILGIRPPFNPTIREINNISPRPLYELEDGKRLNILIPSINKEHFFGGISTALDFFNKLAAEMGVKTRIIVLDSIPTKDDYAQFKNYVPENCLKSAVSDHQIVEFYDRNNKTLPIAKGDIFIATAWWTAYNIIPVIKWQAKQYQIPVSQLIYFIQDFEPGFYPWSTQYLLADSTYQSDVPTIAIFNSKQLKDYFKANDYCFYKQFFFDLTLNSKLKDCLNLQQEFHRKKQILVYGRPSVARNAFELIVDSLKKWAKLQPDYAEWTLLSVGEMHPDVKIADNLILKSVGKLTISEYANVMLNSYLGISLMVSPHPSYPPLEMSTFGVKTITNSYNNKDLSGFNDNLVSLTDCSADNIASKMFDLCNHYNPNNKPDLNEKYVYSNNVYNDILNELKNFGY